MMDEGEDRVRATYGKNYNRLAKIKKRYDPTNFPRESEYCPRQLTMDRPPKVPAGSKLMSAIGT
jgi:hypothetical protein